jgi:uncharacterized repeat protein (TIGR03803 family)/probable HAF family extracellular repeat protein
LWQQANGTTTVTDLGTLPSFSAVSEAEGINARGLTVGYSQAANLLAHATLWQKDAGVTTTDLGTLSSTISVNKAVAPMMNGAFSVATGINSQNQVVGWGYTGDLSNHPVHAALWQQQNGAWLVTDLGTLGSAPVGQPGSPASGSRSAAFAINSDAAKLKIVGHSVTASGNLHAVMWQVSQPDNPNDQGTQITDLGTLPSSDGSSTTPANGTQSDAYGINSSGAIIGESTYPGGGAQTHAVLWQDGQIYDLNKYLPANNKANWVLTSANGITNDGTITGTGTLNGQPTAFLLTMPVPPDSSIALHSFNPFVEGACPRADLIRGSDGNFYGTTLDSVFKITPAGVETVLHMYVSADFANGRDYSDLIQGSDGNFYGTAQTGGNWGGVGNVGGSGTVFKLTPSGQFTVLHAFDYKGGDGAEPLGGVTQGSDGNFYGTTSTGGAHGNGTVFKITSSGVHTVLYSFGAVNNDAAHPSSRLTQGPDGGFYGTTPDGGAYGKGTVFKITSAGAETVLYSFGTVKGGGANPRARLIQGSDGYFYGTTSQGGENNTGMVFKINALGSSGGTLYSFAPSGSGDGATPLADLMQDSNGNLYGTTSEGGAYNRGTVFKITSSGMESVLYSFGASVYNSDGFTPRAGVTQGADGNLYGTTSVGGKLIGGTVFKLPHG